jgi:hypothetical protein
MAKNKAVAAIDEANDWRVQSDLDTYIRWREIKRDKKRLAAVKKLAEEKLKDYASVANTVSDNDGDE